jgi:hypothetical protein
VLLPSAQRAHGNPKRSANLRQAKLPAQTLYPRNVAQMRTSDPDESQLMFLVFDLIHQDGVDLRAFTPVRAQA